MDAFRVKFKKEKPRNFVKNLHLLHEKVLLDFAEDFARFHGGDCFSCQLPPTPSLSYSKSISISKTPAPSPSITETYTKTDFCVFDHTESDVNGIYYHFKWGTRYNGKHRYQNGNYYMFWSNANKWVISDLPFTPKDASASIILATSNVGEISIILGM